MCWCGCEVLVLESSRDGVLKLITVPSSRVVTKKVASLLRMARGTVELRVASDEERYESDEADGNIFRLRF
jgi:hypothetical protein